MTIDIEPFIVPGRQCAGCSACCFALGLDTAEITKPEATWCPHCTRPGCGIYAQRPQICRGYACNWLVDAQAPLMWRPDQRGWIVDFGDMMPDSPEPGKIMALRFIHWSPERSKQRGTRPPPPPDLWEHWGIRALDNGLLVQIHGVGYEGPTPAQYVLPLMSTPLHVSYLEHFETFAAFCFRQGDDFVGAMLTRPECLPGLRKVRPDLVAALEHATQRLEALKQSDPVAYAKFTEAVLEHFAQHIAPAALQPPNAGV